MGSPTHRAKVALRSLAVPLHRGRWAGREARLRWRTRSATPPAGARSDDLVLVSPHLDDAVLSCTGLLSAHPGARVVTAYTAGPRVWDGLTDWDRACGFRPGVDVMAIRKREDVTALSLLAATPVWLDLVEYEYHPRPTQAEVTERLRQALQELVPEPSVLAIPLGVEHPDHVTVADGMLTLRADGLLAGATWLAYGELPYTDRSPDVVAARIRELEARGTSVEPSEPRPTVDLTLKGAAVSRYRTQIRPLWGGLPLHSPVEHLWRLT